MIKIGSTHRENSSTMQRSDRESATRSNVIPTGGVGPGARDLKLQHRCESQTRGPAACCTHC
jgi:hypothetical protein